MHVVVLVLQLALALLSFAGGAYKLFMFDELATMPATVALSRGVWGTLGVLEMTCGVLLIVPTLVRRMRRLTTLAAATLVVESLALAALYARYSMAIAATNPLVWVVAMAVMAGVVAYGRYRP